jgi:hypothetical protein
MRCNVTLGVLTFHEEETNNPCEFIPGKKKT